MDVVGDSKVRFDWKLLHRHEERVLLTLADTGRVSPEMSLHYYLWIPLHQSNPFGGIVRSRYIDA